MTMQPFDRLDGIAAPLIEDNVDTDVIFPARFLLLTVREGLGAYAFNERRYGGDGHERPEFILNRAPWRQARILIAGANFGCGSSREQAVWALLGFGIRCVIAPSFGEIFFGNCFRNGVLPIVLPPAQVEQLASHASAGRMFLVDLPANCITVDGGTAIVFDIAEDRKSALLNGWDETALILNTHGDAIDAFERTQRTSEPWLYDAKASA